MRSVLVLSLVCRRNDKSIKEIEVLVFFLQLREAEWTPTCGSLFEKVPFFVFRRACNSFVEKISAVGYIDRQNTSPNRQKDWTKKLFSRLPSIIELNNDELKKYIKEFADVSDEPLKFEKNIPVKKILV